MMHAISSFWMFSLLYVLLLPTFTICGATEAEATTEPSWAPTGRLSQFRGFASPRPHGIPSNAHMMYASVWAGWSAWSFCSNGVHIRVRACNTVKGFSCLGPNQETRPCDGKHSRHHLSEDHGRKPSDYDVVDPWELDREEAMNQLYPDESTEQGRENENFAKIKTQQPFRMHSAGKTHDLSSKEAASVSLPLGSSFASMNSKSGTPSKSLIGEQSTERKVDEHKERKHKTEMTSHTLQEETDNSHATRNGLSKARRIGESRKKPSKIQHAFPKLQPQAEKDENPSSGTVPSRLQTQVPTCKSTQKTWTTVSTTTSTTQLPPKKEKLDSIEDITAPLEEHRTTKSEGNSGDSFSAEVVEIMEEPKDGTLVFGKNPEIVQPVTASAPEETGLFEEVLPSLPDETVEQIKLQDNERNIEDLTEEQLLRAMKANAERNGVHVVAPHKKEKKKGFGITGFAIRKAHSGESLHFGEVTTTTVSSTNVESPLFEEAPMGELSVDTLNALDWMLKNMTAAAEKEDNKFLNEFEGIPLAPTNKAASVGNELLLPSLKSSRKSSKERLHKQRKHKKVKKLRKFRKSKTGVSKGLHFGEYRPVNFNPDKMFPKFRERQINRSHSRALGIRTVIADKDTDNKPVNFGSNYFVEQDPQELIDEISKLQELMKNMESDIDSIPTSSAHEQVYPIQPESFKLKDERVAEKQKTHEMQSSYRKKSALDLNTSFEQYKNPMFEQPETLRIVTSAEENPREATWSDWSDWGQCFCEKQVRTRMCTYGVASDGCEGDAHETRDCKGGICPTTSTPTEYTTHQFSKSPERIGFFSHNSRRNFRPHRLQPASTLL